MTQEKSPRVEIAAYWYTIMLHWCQFSMSDSFEMTNKWVLLGLARFVWQLSQKRFIILEILRSDHEWAIGVLSMLPGWWLRNIHRIDSTFISLLTWNAVVCALVRVDFRYCRVLRSSGAIWPMKSDYWQYFPSWRFATKCSAHCMRFLIDNKPVALYVLCIYCWDATPPMPYNCFHATPPFDSTSTTQPDCPLCTAEMNEVKSEQNNLRFVCVHWYCWRAAVE